MFVTTYTLMKQTILITIFSLATLLSLSQDSTKTYQKAIEFFEKKEYAKTIKELNKLLAVDSNKTDYLFLKANALAELNQLESAYNIYTKIIKQDSEDVSALSQRGLLLSSIKEFDAAIQDFDNALKVKASDSAKVFLLVNRGSAKAATRDFEGAYDDFLKAYKIDTLNIGTLNNLAVVCDETGRGNETLKYLYKVVDINPKFVGSYCNIGFKYQGMDNHNKAIEFFDKALQIEKNQPLALNNRGFSKYKLGDLKGALSDVNKSILYYPSNSFAYKNRALIYLAMQEVTKACEDLHAAIKMGFTEMYGKEVMDLIETNCK